MEIEFKHPNGWKDYERMDVLLDYLYSSLVLRDRGGNWVYYNFTSGSGWWSSDTEPHNDVVLELNFLDEDNDVEEIESIKFVINNSSHETASQLQNMRKHILENFGLLEYVR